MPLATYDVFTAPFYRRVYNEEGPYEVVGGYNVFAKVGPDQDGNIDYYGYNGVGSGCSALHPFADNDAADRFAARVRSAGSINADHFWFCVGGANIHEVPDYVERWWLPEYN
jgi:hypothetical protein